MRDWAEDPGGTDFGSQMIQIRDTYIEGHE
jgi:hypothetical protein